MIFMYCFSYIELGQKVRMCLFSIYHSGRRKRFFFSRIRDGETVERDRARDERSAPGALALSVNVRVK